MPRSTGRTPNAAAMSGIAVTNMVLSRFSMNSEAATRKVSVMLLAGTGSGDGCWAPVPCSVSSSRFNGVPPRSAPDPRSRHCPSQKAGAGETGLGGGMIALYRRLSELSIKNPGMGFIKSTSS